MLKFKVAKNIYITAGARELINRHNLKSLFFILDEHMRLSEHTCCKEDMEVNLYSVRYGGMILTTHNINNNTIWIISYLDGAKDPNELEVADNTTILLPSEY